MLYSCFLLEKKNLICSRNVHKLLTMLPVMMRARERSDHY